MSLFAFDACVNFCLLSPSTGFFLFFVAQKGRPYFWCLQYMHLSSVFPSVSTTIPTQLIKELFWVSIVKRTFFLLVPNALARRLLSQVQQSDQRRARGVARARAEMPASLPQAGGRVRVHQRRRGGGASADGCVAEIDVAGFML